MSKNTKKIITHKYLQEKNPERQFPPQFTIQNLEC